MARSPGLLPDSYQTEVDDLRTAGRVGGRIDRELIDRDGRGRVVGRHVSARCTDQQLTDRPGSSMTQRDKSADSKTISSRCPAHLDAPPLHGHGQIDYSPLDLTTQAEFRGVGVHTTMLVPAPDSRSLTQLIFAACEPWLRVLHRRAPHEPLPPPEPHSSDDRAASHLGFGVSGRLEPHRATCPAGLFETGPERVGSAVRRDTRRPRRAADRSSESRERS